MILLQIERERFQLGMFIFPSSEPAITIGAYIFHNVLIFDLSGTDTVKCYDCVTSFANLSLDVFLYCHPLSF
jgi:hypothetical protein